MRPAKTLETILFGILLLFFLQTLTDFIQAIYAFGLLVTAFTIQVASIILLFTPIAYLFFHKPPSRLFLSALAYIAMLGRLLAPMLDPGGKLVACGVSVGAFMLLFPVLLHSRKQIRGWGLLSALVMAVSLSILLHVASSGLDLSEAGVYQLISWLLGGVAGILIFRVDWSIPGDTSENITASGWRVTGLTVGLASVILVLYFAFASPAVIARWTGDSYPAIIIVLTLTLTASIFAFATGRFAQRLTQPIILGWNLLFILMLVLTILPHQVAFPANPDAFPLEAPAGSPLGAVFLYLMLILSPILFLDFMLFARQISIEKPALRQLGGSFTLAALFFLIMVFFHVFTTIYDYAPGIGPLFRDRFWFVYLLAGLGMGLPMLLVGKEAYNFEHADIEKPVIPTIVSSLTVLSIIALFMTMSKPVPQPAAPTQFKVMTYNIQQGFDKVGNSNLDGQLAVIRSVDPDILGLQESDTARVSNGNLDAVRYFADNLNMYSYYGPTTTTGTFGIALLSKYPIQNASTFFMYSTGEQTATIQAEIDPGGKAYQIFVTHLGNSGPMVQLQDMLVRIDGLQNVIAMGDYNFKPTTDQYARMTQTLADAWLLKWPSGKDTPGVPTTSQIDHLFVSHGTSILEAEYVANPASDHPYLYSVIQR